MRNLFTSTDNNKPFLVKIIHEKKMKDIHEKVQAAMQDNEKNAHGTAQQAIPKSPKSL